MRIMVFFDLPVVEEVDRKRYTRFRRYLLNDGYYMLQYSIYTRLCRGDDSVEKHLKRLQKQVPPEGSIQVLTVTDKQYGKMLHLVGKPSKQDKINQEQLQFILL